jgi:hypothetical protein
MHVQMMAMMVREQRNAEVKRPDMQTEGRRWLGRKANGRECGNSNESADLSHDQPP